jgi:hypothetical protein
MDKRPRVKYTTRSNCKETGMTQIRCDACRKDIRDARKDVNYYVILGRDLCTPCNEKLYGTVSKAMVNRKPYRYGEYQTLLAKTILKMTAG